MKRLPPNPCLLIAAITLLSAAVWTSPVTAQAEAAPQQRSSCTLILEPEPSTIGNRMLIGKSLVYHLGGGMLWRCGNAEMEADSAIRYETERRVEMLGNVQYRDTIRTLQSDFLTYYELPDSVVATENVVLKRLVSGSTVRGSRAEFLRALSGREAVTTASGRPHITLYTDKEHRKPPFQVDADTTIMAGEEAATAWGDVVIERPDFTATADSVFFDILGGGGFLFGSPEVKGQGFLLTGDTIRLRFEQSDLREVWALGQGRVKGEAYDVEADRIRASLREELVDGVWAFGPGRSTAISTSYQLYGDSLRFVLTEGQIDSVLAIGDAKAVEVTEGTGPTENEVDRRNGDPGLLQSAQAVDSLVPSAVSDTLPPAELQDTLVAAADSTLPAQPQETLAATTDSLMADSAAAPDSVASPGSQERASTPVVTPDTQVTRPKGGAEGKRKPLGGLREAPQSVESDANWMVGDTLYAVFEVPSTPVRGDSTAKRQIRLLRVVSPGGNARAFFAVVLDSTRTTVMSRNYIIGSAIEIMFQDGAVHSVSGEKAIGVYLDPLEGEGRAGQPVRIRKVRPDTTSTRPRGPGGDSLSSQGITINTYARSPFTGPNWQSIVVGGKRKEGSP